MVGSDRIARVFGRLLTIAAFLSAGLLTIAALGARATPTAPATDVTFSFQPGCPFQQFLVPAGVTSVTVDARGASGGQGAPSELEEGFGGRATATIAVTPGETLQVVVGGAGGFGGGDVGGAGGCNGGAGGGNGLSSRMHAGGGGGGASDVRQGGTALANRVVVAGGGGGGGGGPDGTGGSGGGMHGNSGGPGSGSGGGLGGAGGPYGNGTGVGSAGGPGDAGGGGGGGGGSGGGGGQSGSGPDGGGGGGGGSGYVIPSATNVSLVPGVQLGNGRVTITYSQPTAVTLRSLSATRSSKGVVVRWQTASEIDMLGFNLYRAEKGTLFRLNRALIPSVFGGTAAHAYSWLDRSAPRQRAELRYRVQSVSLDGARNWVGAAAVPR